MLEKLKPCPNCKSSNYIELVRPHFSLNYFYYECWKCHCRTNTCYTMKGARRSWNRRSIHMRRAEENPYLLN